MVGAVSSLPLQHRVICQTHTHTTTTFLCIYSLATSLFPSLSLTLALLGTPAVIPVFLTDYSSCSSYRSSPSPHQPINLLPIKPSLLPGRGGQRCSLMLMFADHTGLNTAGRWRSRCLPVARPSVQTTDCLR